MFYIYGMFGIDNIHNSIIKTNVYINQFHFSLSMLHVRARLRVPSIFLYIYFQIAEIIGGYLAGSLAIITDAAHLLSDCISFIVALIAIYLSKKRPDNRMSFGYKRAGMNNTITLISLFL